MGWVRLVFAGAWLLVAAGLLLRAWLGGADGRTGELAGLLAVGFALWNVARWRQGRTRRAVVRRGPRPATGEYHPEFDFRRPDDPSPTRERGM